MPLVYLGTGWFIGIALASALHLPIEFLFPAFLVPIGGLFLWPHDRRAQMIRGSVIFAIGGAFWFAVRSPHFDQNSLSTYNGIGTVTIEGVITVGVIALLNTTGLNAGYYRITVSVNPSASAGFSLDSTAPLRAPEGTGTIFVLDGFGLIPLKLVFLPVVIR
jgi:hypothetical protein